MLNTEITSKQIVEKTVVTQTESLDNLFGALAKAQAEMEVAGLNSSNPFFKSKYADLASVVKASRPALAKHALCVIQQILMDKDGHQFLHTKLCHASGQWIESHIRIVPPKNDVQTLGSYITYLRRYSYAAIVGVVVSDEDDDAEGTRQEKTAQAPEKISPDQLQTLTEALESCEDVVDQIKVSMKIKSLSEMPHNMFQPALKRIRQIKQERAQHA
jgi:hypothetical protein